MVSTFPKIVRLHAGPGLDLKIYSVSRDLGFIRIIANIEA